MNYEVRINESLKIAYLDDEADWDYFARVDQGVLILERDYGGGKTMIAVAYAPGKWARLTAIGTKTQNI